jgi:DNA-binding IclR family transcriptional regulator
MEPEGDPSMDDHAGVADRTASLERLVPAFRTIARAFALLEIVAAAPDGIAVKDIAVQAGLEKSTASRLLAALRELGYLRQRTSDRAYFLGGRVLTLAQGYKRQLNMREIARPHLQSLRDETGQTVHLAIRDEREVVYVDQFEPDGPLRLHSAVGRGLPLHVTAMGRAILAKLPPPEREDLLRRLTADGRFSGFVVDLDHVREEVERASREDWATVDRHDDLSRVGAAITDSAGRPVAAISVSGPSFTMNSRIREYASRCIESARAISAELRSLGY